MTALLPGSIFDATELHARYLRNRERSAQIFALIEACAYYERPIPLRHPFAFYEGHLPAFSAITLNERALGEDPVDARLERLFQRGIDPAGDAEAARHTRADWPARNEIEAFARRCDARVAQAIRSAGNSARDAIHTILEHEEMHQETLMYIVHRTSREWKGRIRQRHHDAPEPQAEPAAIPAGAATLGAQRSSGFGWDNEFEETSVAVPAFAIDRYPVTNGAYLAFVRDGGPTPPFWIERDGEFHLLGVFDELPLPLSWPVYATHQQARAYAAWRGARLATEAQFHRAAFGTPSGEERPYPWGAEPPSALHGNFDFERYDPEPVDAHPAGTSAWGVADLIGNGWEWTASPFEPLPGFVPMPTYPQYSADFFDGRHYVLKGASPVTARELIRRSFRNWFYEDYPYMYAKFRCVL